MTVERGGALLYAAAGLLILSALLAETIYRRYAPHRPVARSLVALAGLILVRLSLHTLVLHGGPYTGLARAAFHVEQLTRLVTAMVPAWVAWGALGRMGYPPWPSTVALGYVIGGWVTLVVAYPNLSGEALRLGYLAAELVSLAIAIATILSWARRRGWRDDGSVRTHTWLAALMICAADFALLFVGAWPRGLFGASYSPQQAGLVALYGSLVVLHVIALRTVRAP